MTEFVADVVASLTPLVRLKLYLSKSECAELSAYLRRLADALVEHEEQEERPDAHNGHGHW